MYGYTVSTDALIVQISCVELLLALFLFALSLQGENLLGVCGFATVLAIYDYTHYKHNCGELSSMFISLCKILCRKLVKVVKSLLIGITHSMPTKKQLSTSYIVIKSMY